MILEVKIRGLDVGAVHIIDERARKMGVSRNEYLKRQLESNAWSDKVQGERNRFEEYLIESVVQFKYVERWLISQESRIDLLSALMMQALDVTEEELVQFEKDMKGEEDIYD